MSDGHCFISYSTADGLDFTRRLAEALEGGDPFYPVWYDKRDLKPGIDWDDQIVEAIQKCKCIVFVMTEDSTKPKSDCKQEIVFALRYKKPIAPLLVQKNAQPLFVLGNREWIDFTSEINAGMAKLHQYLRELDLPEGLLRALKERLTDAEHDLRRATGDDENRIKKEIEELNSQIQVQEKIITNPQAAAEQTQKNIETGLEREREPEKPSAAKTTTKFINPPPGVAPNYFQDRQFETRQISDFLRDDAQRMMTISGRGGIGKTAMVCRVLKALEGGNLPDDLGPMKVDGIVYLSESGSHRVNFANIFADLSKLLPSETASKLDAHYKDPKASIESKMNALAEQFQGKRVLLLLDNFEPVVDPETQKIRDSELDEALRAFLNGAHTALNIIITTRIPPSELNEIQPGRQRLYPLEAGLAPKYAKDMLRQMDADGILGLKTADENLLQKAYERTRGFPKALEALFQILSSDRYTTLEELLVLPTIENVVEALVGEAFNRLDQGAQMVMQALAVYNRPVTPAAVDYLLAPHLPAIDSAPILQRLANMHFARKESGRFYLHPVDREFGFGLIPEKDLTSKDTKVTKEEQKDKLSSQAFADLLAQMQKRTPNPARYTGFDRHELTERAADYFAQARKPRLEWKKLEDLGAQLAEFDLRCAAGDYDTACSVLVNIDYDYLLLWGHFYFLIDLHSRIRNKIKDKNLQMSNLNILGIAYRFIGKIKESITIFEDGLRISRETKELSLEASFLGNLGSAYSELNDPHKAIEFYEQALIIAQGFEDRNSEGKSFYGIGNEYGSLGNLLTAIEFQEKGLIIFRETRNSRDEGAALSNLGNYYSLLGESEKAVDYYNQALKNARKIGNKYGESKRLEGLAEVLIDQGNLQSAIKRLQKSLEIGQDMSNPEVCLGSGSSLAEAYLLQTNLSNARATIETALQYNSLYNDSSATTLYGIIALRQEDGNVARQAFTRAIKKADEILAKTPDFYDALDAKGLAFCGLILVGADLRVRPEDAQVQTHASAPTLNGAIETFRKARKIAPHAGVVKRVLRLFDELAKCDPEGILKDIRPAAEGKE